jgi:hypothetical protein
VGTYIFLFAQFSIAVSEVARLSFGTVFTLLEMLAQLSLKQIVELLPLLSFSLLTLRVVSGIRSIATTISILTSPRVVIRIL